MAQPESLYLELIKKSEKINNWKKLVGKIGFDNDDDVNLWCGIL